MSRGNLRGRCRDELRNFHPRSPRFSFNVPLICGLLDQTGPTLRPADVSLSHSLRERRLPWVSQERLSLNGRLIRPSWDDHTPDVLPHRTSPLDHWDKPLLGRPRLDDLGKPGVDWVSGGRGLSPPLEEFVTATQSGSGPEDRLGVLGSNVLPGGYMVGRRITKRR